MAITFNDSAEIKKAQPWDSRDQVQNLAELILLPVSYNYLGLRVFVLTESHFYQLTSGSGADINDWTILESLLFDDKTPTLGGDLDANNFNIVNAKNIQGHRESNLYVAGIVVGDAHRDKMARFAITGDTVITVDDSSNGLPIDTELEIFQQSGAFVLSVAVSGAQTIISKDGALNLTSIGSAAILKKIGDNLWMLVGSLIS